MPDRSAIATAIADACRRLHARGLLAGAEGNVSVRLPDGDLLITRTGADKATITAADVLTVHGAGPLHHDGAHRVDRRDDSGRDIAPRPSSEVGMHRACYAARSDVHAVVHAHPPAASGFATAGFGLPADVLPELPVVVGPVALVPYGRPGTPALEQAMAPFLASHEAFLLANHGVTTLGRSLEDALLRMESVEQAARILLAAHMLGGWQRLAPSEALALAALHAASTASAPG
jgi:L-fuculose-phosphate aldolase